MGAKELWIFKDRVRIPYCQKEEYLITNFYCDDSASGKTPFDEIV
jgi:hypothetical protein